MSCPQERKKRSLWKGRKKEGEKKEKRGENEPTHNAALSRGRDNATSYENAKAREKKWARPTLGFSCVVFAGKETAQSPPPPKEKKIPSIASFTSYIENY